MFILYPNNNNFSIFGSSNMPLFHIFHSNNSVSTPLNKYLEERSVLTMNEIFEFVVNDNGELKKTDKHFFCISFYIPIPFYDI